MTKIENGVKRILSNVGWMTFDKVFVLLLNLIVTVKIANYYGSSEYGEYQYVVSVIALFEILIKFVNGRVVKKEYDKYDSNIVVVTTTVSRLIFSFVSAIAGLVFLVIYKGDRNFSLMFLILLLNAIVVNLRFGMTNRFEYLLKSKKVVVAADASLIVGSLLQMLAVYMECSIVVIAAIALITSFINFLIVWLQYKMEFGNIVINKSLNVQLLTSIIKESVPLAIAASCSTIYSRCDSIMIGRMLSVGDVGVYAISLKLISIVQIAIHPICESVYPRLIKIYNDNKKKYEHIYIRITSVLTWLYIMGVLISFIILPYAFRLLKPEYAEALPIYKVYVIGSFFIYNGALRTGHFTMIKRGIILTYISVASVILNLILNWILISRFGLYGAAFATAITSCVANMLLLAVFKKEGREVFKWQIRALNPLRMFF